MKKTTLALMTAFLVSPLAALAHGDDSGYPVPVPVPVPARPMPTMPYAHEVTIPLQTAFYHWMVSCPLDERVTLEGNNYEVMTATVISEFMCADKVYFGVRTIMGNYYLVDSNDVVINN